jgi:polysaccharide pyruvyl transferase WcaK-like protein
MRVLLIHAYSTTNSGDGLLVKEATDLVRESLPGAQYTILALDPESFRDPDAVAILHPLTGESNGIGSASTLVHGLGALLRRKRNARIEELLQESDLVVAVGGGYLRTKSPIEAIKATLTHYVQLPRRSDLVPFIYLPQSIGPLRFGLRNVFASRLRFASSVIARDDRSSAELIGLTNLHRAPDMALLGLPAAWTRSSIADGDENHIVGIVARRLSTTRVRATAYEDNIQRLGRSSGAEFLAQATGRGNNDPEFYKSLGIAGPFRSLKGAVNVGSEARPSVVISVRLHGSIETIRSGVPSIHLSYERKGWGAYDDLGIPRFVHNVFDFDPKLVLAQVEELQSDPSSYWDSVEGAVSHLKNERARMVALIGSAASQNRALS